MFRHSGREPSTIRPIMESIEGRVLLSASIPAAAAVMDGPVRMAEMNLLAPRAVAQATVSIVGKWRATSKIVMTSDGRKVLSGDGPAVLFFNKNGTLTNDMGLPMKWSQKGNKVTFSIDGAKLAKQSRVRFDSVSYDQRVATVSGNTMTGAFICTLCTHSGSRPVPIKISITKIVAKKL